MTNRTNVSPETPEIGRREALALGAAGLAAAAATAAGAPARAAEEGHGGAVRELAGRTALVTGGARGIGLASAEELARAGANVVLFDIAAQIGEIPYALATEGDLADAREAVEDLGVGCAAVRGDVRDRAALDRAVAAATDRFGGLDILVANAGVTQVGVLEEFSDEQSQAVMDINVGGVVKSIQAAVPALRARGGGRIVTIASILGRMGNAEFPVYSASKWGVIGITKSAALSLGKENITCNAVCPGLIRTKLVDNEYALRAMSPDAPTWDALDAFIGAQNPMGVGSFQPVDIARVVRFFCGPATAHVSGEAFDFSGGANALFNA